MFALQINHRASVTPHIIFLVVIQRLVSRIKRQKRLSGLLFRVRSFSHSKLGIFFIPAYSSLAFSSFAFSTPALHQRPLNTQYCIYMSLQKSGNEQLTHYDCEIMRKVCIFTVNLSAPAAQQRSQVTWLTPVKPEKTPVQQRVRCFRALSFDLTPPTPTIKPCRR